MEVNSMRLVLRHRRATHWLAASALILSPAQLLRAHESQPLSTSANANAVPRLTIHDVALHPGGLLQGQILNENCRPVPDATVAIQSDGQTIAETRTDSDGVFAVAGLRGGVHQVVTDGGVETCRLWATNTAPPRAAQSLHIFRTPHLLARGQYHAPPLLNSFVQNSKQWATNPFIVGGIVAAAVAIPVAIHNADDKSGS
jgi:hypothetical protein